MWILAKVRQLQLTLGGGEIRGHQPRGSRRVKHASSPRLGSGRYQDDNRGEPVKTCTVVTVNILDTTLESQGVRADRVETPI